MIIILTGTPGTGKTVLGNLLSKEIDCSLTSTSTLLKEHGLTRTDPTGRFTEIVDDEISSAVETLVRESQEDKCIVLETIYPSLWLSYKDLDYEIPLIILLRAHPVELYNRLKTRNWPEQKIIENALSEAFNIIAEELLDVSHDVLEIDTSRKTAIQSLELLYDKLEEWRTGISIDWISDPDVQNLVARWSIRMDLDKYRLGL
ncbi:MAG: AAA family ATPase [Desulfurococcales archaeon]|nr:AAA family ATPase [Desulfurococcales archaeon]MEB3789307.1 AAA family ATPase [Desulfurococcales archaeon]